MSLHRIVAVAAACLAFGAACTLGLQPGGPPIFVIEVGDEVFRIQVEDEAQLAPLETRLLTGLSGVINGSLVAGDGGFNAPWSWHLDPATVRAADAGLATCDGPPSAVEGDLQRWLTSVKQFCPWQARVVARER